MSISLIRGFDKTHFIAAAASTTDSRVQLGSLLSDTASNEVYICTGFVGSTPTWTLLTGGSGAPTGSQYVTLATDGTLSAERVLTAGAGISITDAGAGSTVTIAATGAAAASSFLRTFALMGC